uniref:Uncharacterized protein n=1 Tax=Tanacetum cinerariifolium TaxID=118510 RepID=A0A699TEC5_TANCI|nr:hypothetical protein [Tanacetum cinerariifolium]
MSFASDHSHRAFIVVRPHALALYISFLLTLLPMADVFLLFFDGVHPALPSEPFMDLFFFCVWQIKMSGPTEGANIKVNLRGPLGLGKWASVFVNVLISWLLRRSLLRILAESKKEHH